MGNEERLGMDKLLELFVIDDNGVLRWAKKRMKGRRRCGEVAGYTNSNGYTVVNHLGKLMYYHRIVYALHYGAFPSGVIDHINGNRSDNRICNLRDVTPSENQRNLTVSKPPKSGVRGVYYDRIHRRWMAAVGKNPTSGRIVYKQTGSLFDAVCLRRSAEIAMGYSIKYTTRKDKAGDSRDEY